MPQWLATGLAMIKGEDVGNNGDGEIGRDFCYIDNSVWVNLLAATLSGGVNNQVYNVARNDRTGPN